MTTWFDSHCHIGPEKAAIAEDIVRAAHLAGVANILVPGTSLEDCGYAVELTSMPGVYASVGMHPHTADTPFQMSYFRDLLAVPGVKAVGEIGLDYHYDFSSRENQRRIFASFLALAVEINLPAVIHCRDAFQDTIDIVKDNLPSGYPFEIHSVTATVDEHAQWLELGAMLSFNGMVTFNKGDNIREILALTPLDRIMLETDSPYLAPVPLRGQENTPANIPLIGAKAALVLNKTVEEIAKITTENAISFFKVNNTQSCSHKQSVQKNGEG